MGWIFGCVMAEISVLYVDEVVEFDQKQVRHLFKLLGNKEASLVMASAMGELAERLTRAEALFQAGNMGELTPVVQGIEKIATEIGMRSLTQASRAVLSTIRADVTAATSATFFRLLRIGDRSLSDYRLLCDTSG